MMLFNFESPAKVKYFLISTNLTRVFIGPLQILINRIQQKSVHEQRDVNIG